MGRYSFAYLLLPSAMIFGIFYLVPLAFVLITSFYTYIPGGQAGGIGYTFTLGNYARFFLVPYYVKNLVLTLRLSVTAALIATIFAYALAYYVARSTGRRKKVVLTLVILSFMLSSIARVYAWVVTLSDVGIVNIVLQAFGFGYVKILNTEIGVMIGLVHYDIPLAVMTMAGPISAINPSLEEAANGLGANKLKTFLRVTLPLSMPGILAAVLLEYSLGVSAFMVPMVLGGGFVDMMGNLIYDRYIEVVNIPFGSALSIVLLIVCIGLAYILNKVLSSRIRPMDRSHDESKNN